MQLESTKGHYFPSRQFTSILKQKCFFSRTLLLACLFAPLSVLSLVFSVMKGKSKSKTIPVSGDQRTRLRDKRRIIAWRTEGKSREDVQKLLCPSGTEVKIGDSLWKKIWREREAIKSADCPLKDFRLDRTRTDGILAGKDGRVVTERFGAS